MGFQAEEDRSGGRHCVRRHRLDRRIRAASNTVVSKALVHDLHIHPLNNSLAMHRWGSYVIWTMARKIRRAGTLPSSDANKSNLDLYRQAALHDMRSIDDRTTMDLSVEKKGDHTDSTQSLPPLKYEGSTDHEGVTPDVALVSEYDFSSGSNSGWEPSRQVSKKGDEAPPVASGSHSAHQVGLN